VFSANWQLSARRFSIRHERDVAIPLPDGVTLDTDILRPDEDGRFPVLLSVHAYDKRDQLMPIPPAGFSPLRGHIEAGDSAFFVRRGYVHAILNVRGTGSSGGTYDNLGPQSINDICDAIAWLAAQPWSNGRVGMFGISYFSIVQPLVAARKPPALHALFAPYGYTDMYRDRYYHGGILSHKFMQLWVPSLHNPRVSGMLIRDLGENAFNERVAQALRDNETTAVPFLRGALGNARQGANALIADILCQPLDNDYYRARSVDYDLGIEVPAYFGACWGVYGLHLPGAFRSFDGWRGPKRLTIGPPIYLDRPFYQYHLEALRWFDHWLKDNDTGMLDEPAVQLFIDGTGHWKQADTWPLPETRFTRFYLHENGVLSERDYSAAEGFTTFSDSPYAHDSATFWTPPMVEATEICGPMALNLYGSTTDIDVLWFVSLLHRNANGHERILTRGWLRGSQRAIDPDHSKPWQPYHRHDRREPLTPGAVYEFNIEVRPYGIELKPDERIGLRIKCADDETPANGLEVISMGHLSRPTGARVTVHHDDQYPSHLVLPVTAGNRIGTFMSGGQLGGLLFKPKVDHS